MTASNISLGRYKVLITVRNSSCGKVMFLHLSVILFTGEGEVSAARSRDGGVRLRAWGVHPLGRHPQADPQAGNPPGQTPFYADTAPQHPETATAADGTHPTGMHSCFEKKKLHLQNLTVRIHTGYLTPLVDAVH